MVLHDQMKVLADFDQTVGEKGQRVANPQNKVLRSHLDRIRQMDKLATKTYQAVCRRVDLREHSDDISLMIFLI